MPERHRQSIRLPSYDYRLNGAYFVTVCAHRRETLFEDFDLRRTIDRQWQTIPSRFPFVRLDAFVIMPNHLHGILWLTGEPRVGAPLAGALDVVGPGGFASRAGASPAPTSGAQFNDGGGNVGAPLAGALDVVGVDGLASRAGASPAPKSGAPTLGEVVGAFKSQVAVEWLRWIKANRPRQSAQIWQRNYYERVVRGDHELSRIREYIQQNPIRWNLDHENPKRVLDATWDMDWAWLEQGRLN